MSVILTVRKLKEEDHYKVKASLVYRELLASED